MNILCLMFLSLMVHIRYSRVVAKSHERKSASGSRDKMASKLT